MLLIHLRHDNTFLNGLMDMTAGDGPKHPCWSTERTREWRADCEDPETTRPHVMLVICTGVEAKESELLFAELGPIAQAIQCRFAQKEFENTSLFPVRPICSISSCHTKYSCKIFLLTLKPGTRYLALWPTAWAAPASQAHSVRELESSSFPYSQLHKEKQRTF